MAEWGEESVAAELLACEAERRDREPFTDEWPELDVDTGYRIQDANLDKRVARGETVVGVKLGLTSEAKQRRMGVYVPFVAWLTDDMIMNPGDPVPQSKLIHPRVEPEIVFVMKDRLEGPVVTREPAMAAVSTIAGGAEVIDSRYRNFRFRAGDVIADNASAVPTWSSTTPCPGRHRPDRGEGRRFPPASARAATGAVDVQGTVIFAWSSTATAFAACCGMLMPVER